MLTLKEKLEHGDLDSFLSPDEVKELLGLFDDVEDLDLIDQARDEGFDDGKTEGREEGKEEGEEEEFDRLKDRYLEIKKEKIGDIILPEFGVLRYLITDLDELFEATE